MMNRQITSVSGNVSNEVSLFHEAIAKAEDPRRRGMFIASEDGLCYLSMLDQVSLRMKKYAVTELLADLQINQGRHGQIGLKEIIDNNLYIFMYNADFNPEVVATNGGFSEPHGTFVVFTSSDRSSNTHLIAASDVGDKLDLAAIGVANKKTHNRLGLRALFTSTPRPFGVVSVTTTKEIIALWHWEKLGNDKARALPANEDEQGPRPLPGEYRWGDNYER